MKLTDDERDFLVDMGLALAGQDNACTADPIFMVQRCRRVYGIDADYTDQKAWIDEENREFVYDPDVDDGAPDDPSDDWFEEHGYTLVGYRDLWENVQPFFTRAAADRYIERYGYNLTGPEKPRVYVNSAYRNREWQAVRALLRRIGAEGGIG